MVCHCEEPQQKDVAISPRPRLLRHPSAEECLAKTERIIILGEARNLTLTLFLSRRGRGEDALLRAHEAKASRYIFCFVSKDEGANRK